MIKILHILSNDDTYGSAQCLLELLSREILRDDILPIVVTPAENNITRFCKERQITCLATTYEQSQIPNNDNRIIFIGKYYYHMYRYYRFNKNAIERINTFINEEGGVDLIHTNSSVINIGAIISELTGIPHVWHLREFGKEDFNFYPLRRNYIMEMNRGTTAFLAISEVVKNTWTQKGLRNINMLYDGVEQERFSASQTKQDDGKLHLIMVGSFCEAKGQHLVVEALNKLSEDVKKRVRLDLFGGKTSESYYQKVMNIINAHELNDMINVKGYSNKISEELPKYDVGILCSRAEAFGRVTVEYMMAGLCPIVPNTGANIELVQKFQCGILYEAQNTNSLANSINNAFYDMKETTRKGMLGKQIANQYFDIGKNADNIINFFKEVACSQWQVSIPMEERNGF